MPESLPAPEPPGEPDPGQWWPPRRWRNTQKLIVIGASLLLLILIGAVFDSGDDDKGKPSKGVELCESLRDSKDRLLTRGDYERLFDMKDWELQRYVRARCPDQFDRVD
jgi:hypothetical protein